MDLSLRQAIEIVMDWLYGMDESEVAKKHNVDVETVTKLSNDALISNAARESMYGSPSQMDDMIRISLKLTETEAMNMYVLDQEEGLKASYFIILACQEADVDVMDALDYGKEVYERLQSLRDEHLGSEEQSSK